MSSARVVHALAMACLAVWEALITPMDLVGFQSDLLRSAQVQGFSPRLAPLLR